ncbi:MAG: hypothetical protein ABEJ76_07800 [Halanaeroarchaeum sp.]
MTDIPRSRADIEALAARVARTPHPALDEETIDRVQTLVDDLERRLAGEADGEAVHDLLAFWDGYVLGGVEDVVDDVESFRESTTLRERLERGNRADLFGLDLYQALHKLESVVGDDAESPADRARDWAAHVAGLTVDFADHLDDHR